MTQNNPAQALALELKSEGFSRRDPARESPADPLTPIPLVVTLDQLRPYEHNPRCTKNALFDDLKSSIRERGLDTPPAITRRPGGEHYIIRNGGNTRLAVLTELWRETHDERFYRLPCMYHPWPERGDIVLLTGHLTESDLHAGLTYIERALAVEKTRELYEQESGETLTQRELARRLKADGCPIPQPHISRMQEAIEYLLPAIPNVLYGGLGRPQVEKLSRLRRTAEKVWAMRNADGPEEFSALFQDTLSAFDGSLSNFDWARIQDELTGRMAETLGIHYDTLAAEIALCEQNLLKTALASVPPPCAPPDQSAPIERNPRQKNKERAPEVEQPGEATPVETLGPKLDIPPVETPGTTSDLSPVEANERLQSIRELVAGQDRHGVSEAERTVRLQVEGLYPMTDVWNIPPELDAPERLRLQIAQFAREIAHEAKLDGLIVVQEHGMGFACVRSHNEAHSQLARGVLSLLHALSQSDLAAEPNSEIALAHVRNDVGIVLQGRQGCPEQTPEVRLSDDGVLKLFRLIRLSRRLLDGLNTVADDSPES
jgi:ParB family protein of integrating conjugative element (PFGI_1 class)